MNTTLCNHGYKIKKKDLTMKEIKEIKNDLTVNPFVFNDFGDRYFSAGLWS